jgi:glycosyltransferase involved in cell wall biosynthesis
MLEEWRAAGHAVRVVELAGRHPLPDAAAEAAARAALLSLTEGEIALVDGLGLPACDPALLRACRAVALIHHPTALEPGWSEATRAELARREHVAFAACARLVATSSLTARDLPGAEVVEPGTDPAPRASGAGGAAPVILSVGALIPRKGHDVLLRALAGLTDLDWSLRLAGPEADLVHAHGLRALVEELGLTGRVAMLGEVAEIGAEYTAADIFALASWHEGYGMAAAEAMARGLPLALTTGGALAEIVAKPAAILSPPGDFRSLAKGLRRVIFDAGLRAQMAEASWLAGQALPRWPDQAERFASILEQAHG